MSAVTGPQLLVTKTRPPLLPRDWVARPRLSSRLEAAIRHRVVLLSAPAGYGKTSLVVEALRDSGRPAGWVSLDPADNVPAVLLAYLARALQSVMPAACQPILEVLRSPQPPPTDLLLTALVNSITDHQGDIVLVLDDYQAIEAQTVHEAVAFFVEHLPAHAHLVITSRVDPPLPLARWRVRGDLAEIRAGDLSFSIEECSAYLRDAAGIELSEQDLATLGKRTEGWIAGLKMAALSMRGKEDISGFISAFSGSHRYVLDYLVEEVLGRQPLAVRRFLLETSILERLCGPLCDALTGRNDSQSMLVQLESANLFISPLDEERRWYRYHQLFATILRNQLATSGLEPASSLHHRASLWYEREGLAEEAISHSLQGGDVERAADLLEKAATGILIQGQALTVLEYRSRIPPSCLESRPWLSVSLAWAALLSHQWDLLPTLLSRIESALEHGPDRLSATSRANWHQVKGHLLSIRGYIARAQGDVARSIQLSEEANRQLPAENLLTRGANSMNLGIDHLMIGDIAKAVQHLEDATRTALEGGNRTVILSSRAYLAETEMLRLQLDRAADICRETIELGTRWGRVGAHPYTTLAFILLGQAMYERNDLESAEGQLASGIRLAEANYNWAFLVRARLLMARPFQTKGDAVGALRHLRHAEEAATRAPQARESLLMPVWKALLALRQGDIAAASDWARQQEATLPLSRLPDYPQEFAYLTMVRVKLARRECRDLPVHLGRLIRNAEDQGRGAAVMEALTLDALALDRLGEATRAEEALGRALSLGEPAGCVRTFVDEGAPMVELLRRLAVTGKHAGYASRLLGAISRPLPGQHPRPASHEPTPKLPEPLSERELEVLRLIAAGRSNKEIASELVLAVGTVKKHTSNIYGKLGAESRTQAVARARELGIV